jgi:hypothetical protein
MSYLRVLLYICFLTKTNYQMKTKLFFLLGVTCALLLFSCGQNAQEQAATKRAIADSVTKNITMRRATQDSMNAVNEQQKSEQAAAAQACIENKQTLSSTEVQLEVANQKLEDIKKFHIGRLESDKVKEVEEQLSIIQKFKDQIEQLQKALSKCQ